MKQLFVGGFGGSGTRVVPLLLKTAGYFIGDPLIKGTLDYVGPYNNFVNCYDRYHFLGDEEGLWLVLRCATYNRRSWVLKHGHLMYIIDELKEWYPESKFIYVMRNPVDNSINRHNHNTWHRYGGLPENASLEDKVAYYVETSKEVMAKSDYVLRLEEMCNNKEREIARLMKFAHVPPYKYNMETIKKLIKMPESIGIGKSYYDKFDLSEVGY